MREDIAQFNSAPGLNTDLVSWPKLCLAAAEGSPFPVLITEGQNHVICGANGAVLRLIEKNRAELMGKPFAELLPHGEGSEDLALLTKVFQTGESVSATNSVCPGTMSKTQLWSYVAWALVDQDNRPAGLMIQGTETPIGSAQRLESDRVYREIRDINQELLISRVREHELAEMAAAQKEQLFEALKMESIGRLAGGIAHDFNNLLTAILGFTELAGGMVDPQAEVQDLLNHIHKAAERAATLTGQLLAFARKQIIEPKIVDINLLILDMDPMLRRLIGEHILYTLSLDPDISQTSIDPGQFGQVLMNLVVNARDSMPDGGQIVVTTKNITLNEQEAILPEQKPGDYVLLTVSDTGTGIPETMQRHLFEPFFTTKELGKGTGLGLATCYGIVKQNKGNISVVSSLEKGTCFSIYLPKMIDANDPMQKPVATSASQATGVILVVEDEPMVREIEAKILRRHGYIILEAGNGVEALQAIQSYEGTVDLVVTDVLMPLMGGRELADRLRISHPDIKILFTSGYTDDALLTQGIEDSDIAFLHKPFLPAALALKVQELLISK